MRMLAVGGMHAEDGFKWGSLLIDSPVFLPVLIGRGIPPVSQFPRSIGGIIHTVVNGIEDGYKSVAYSLVFRSPERSLEAAEVNKIVDKILKELSRLGVELRA